MKLKRKSLKQQNGAVLVVSLMLLVVMTMLALSMSQTTRLQERMAGNSRDVTAASEAAESALRSGEAFIKTSGGIPPACATLGTCTKTGGALPKETIDSAGIDLAQQNDTWWVANGKEYGTAAHDLSGVAADPQFLIEEAGENNEFDGLTIGRAGVSPPKKFYLVTARARGKSSVTEIVTQSVFTP